VALLLLTILRKLKRLIKISIHTQIPRMPCKCLETKDISNCCPPFEKKSTSCKRHKFNILWYFENDEKYMDMKDHEKVQLMIKLWGLQGSLYYYRGMLDKNGLNPYGKIVADRVYETDATKEGDIIFCHQTIYKMINQLKNDITTIKNQETSKRLNKKLEHFCSMSDNRQELLNIYREVSGIIWEELIEQMTNRREKKQGEKAEKDIQFNHAYE
jgi:hypothetical protein